MNPLEKRKNKIRKKKKKRSQWSLLHKMPALRTCTLVRGGYKSDLGLRAFWLPVNGRNMMSYMIHGICEIKRNQLPRSSPTSSGNWKEILPWVLIKKTMKHFILVASGKGWDPLTKTGESVRILCCLKQAEVIAVGRGQAVIFSP